MEILILVFCGFVKVNVLPPLPPPITAHMQANAHNYERTDMVIIMNGPVTRETVVKWLPGSHPHVIDLTVCTPL